MCIFNQTQWPILSWMIFDKAFHTEDWNLSHHASIDTDYHFVYGKQRFWDLGSRASCSSRNHWLCTIALRMFHFHFAVHMSCCVMCLCLSFFEIGFAVFVQCSHTHDVYQWLKSVNYWINNHFSVCSREKKTKDRAIRITKMEVGVCCQTRWSDTQ